MSTGALLKTTLVEPCESTIESDSLNSWELMPSAMCNDFRAETNRAEYAP